MAALLGAARDGRGPPGARASRPAMKRRGGGVILNNASICAAQPLWYEPIYNTTKAALVMFSKTLANELIPDNIRVNALNPGLVLTPDWIKTAKQLTAGKGGDWEGYIQGVADGARARSSASPRPRRWPNFFVFLCSDSAPATASARPTTSTAAC